MILTRGGTHALARPPVAPYLTVSPAMAAIAFYGTVSARSNARSCPRSMGCESCIASLKIKRRLVMLSDAFSEFGHTRVPLPGELATVSVSLEYAEAKMVDDIFAKATSLGAKARRIL